MLFSIRRLLTAAAVVAGLFGLPAFSAPVFAGAGPIKVKAWAEATPPGADVGVVYLELHNLGSTPDRLVGVTSPVAGKLSLHQSMTMSGMSQMRPLDGVTLPPGAIVRFAPGGTHVMLEQLRRPLKAGDSVPLTLIFDHAAALTVAATVRAPGDPPP
jgi:copper(I)-binding protein